MSNTMSNTEQKEITMVNVPCKHLEAFKNARLEIQNVGIAKKGKNEHFGNTYATLNDIIQVCEPILLRNNILTTFTQVYDKEIIHGKAQSTIHFRMRMTHTETREYFQTFVTMYAERRPQAIGSLLTYAKRYCYEDLLMITGNDDDDGNKAEESLKGKRVPNPADAV